MQTLAAGGASSKRTYDAFGKVVSVTGTWNGPSGYGGKFGYQEDGNGLTLLGHRWYDAEVGRFLTRDPAKQGRNWYAYCDNDPIGRADPQGLGWHNPSQVIVDERFEGGVTVIGEPGKGQSQVAVMVPPGYESHPGMDVDIVIITHPDGRIEYWFISGTRLDNTGIGDEYYIDRNGDIHGPGIIKGLFFDFAVFPPGTKLRDDIIGALGRPCPKAKLPVQSPCYVPGKHPFEIWR